MNPEVNNCSYKKICCQQVCTGNPDCQADNRNNGKRFIAPPTTEDQFECYGFHDFCFNTDQSYPLSVDVAKDSSFFFGKPKICLIIGQWDRHRVKENV